MAFGPAARVVTQGFALLLSAWSPNAAAPQHSPSAPAPAAGSSPVPAAASPARVSTRNANYSIDVELDPATRTLQGREVLTWRNITTQPATELQFHLYYNAWTNDRSTWMGERALSPWGRDQSAPRRGDWGWIDVTAIRLLTSAPAPFTDLTASRHFLAPDDGNPDDRTVMRVPLPRPVRPGESIGVEIAWTSKVPRTFARTGVVDNFYFVAQWFPKIGVLEPTGWNTHQFHAGTEFFSDYGVYDVRITVPRGWVVGATGREQQRLDTPTGKTTHRFVQEDVHDFAWTTSPAFLERRERFEHAGLPPVDMRLLLQPEHEEQAARHFAATRAALQYYGQWYGPYPYGHITIVDPAWQSGAGGMEYPTLFTAGSRWLAPRDATVPEGVTVHEAGHQFWYGIVASNEFEDAWMDEGFNTYATGRVIEQQFQPHYYVKRYFGGFVPWTFRDFPLNRESDGDRVGSIRLSGSGDAQSTPSWRYWPGAAGAITYSKTAVWLHTLERLLGWDTMQRVMSTYFARWAFRHPKPQDFFAVVNQVSGRDMTWFFDQVYRSSNLFDYSVDSFRSEPAAARGYVGDGSSRTFSDSPASGGSFRTAVVARRLGGGQFPVDVRIVFENQEEVRWRWDGLDRWKLFEVEKPVRALFAEVDPDHVLVLDVNVTNNSATLAPRADQAARKWSLAWLVWLQDHLLTYGFFV